MTFRTKANADTANYNDRTKIQQIKSLVIYSHNPRIELMQAACRGVATAKEGRVLADAGLILYDGDNPLPKLTPMGAGVILAHDLGIQFFDVCVFAKVYHTVWQMCELSTMAAQQDSQDMHENRNKIFIPVKTISCFFEDWPVYKFRIRYTLSKLRHKKMLPKCPYKMVTCDVKYWIHLHKILTILSDWVDGRGEMIRNILLRPDVRQGRLQSQKSIATAATVVTPANNSTVVVDRIATSIAQGLGKTWPPANNSTVVVDRIAPASHLTPLIISISAISESQ